MLFGGLDTKMRAHSVGLSLLDEYPGERCFGPCERNAFYHTYASLRIFVGLLSFPFSNVVRLNFNFAMLACLRDFYRLISASYVLGSCSTKSRPELG